MSFKNLISFYRNIVYTSVNIIVLYNTTFMYYSFNLKGRFILFVFYYLLCIVLIA